MLFCQKNSPETEFSKSVPAIQYSLAHGQEPPTSDKNKDQRTAELEG